MQLLGRYEYLENNLIAKGGFSSIYKGIDLKKNSQVAIKVDNNFNNEFIIYNKLKNSKIIGGIIDSIKIENTTYLILPFYENDCYNLWKKQKKKFNEKDIFMFLIQLIKQLKELHSIGYIHNDIKPENIMFDKENNRFTLIDFGLSKIYIENNKHINLNKNVKRVGTLRYMSINCHNKLQTSRRDDLISLAYTVLYLMKINLPWANLNNDNMNKLHSIIKKSKNKFKESINKYKLNNQILYLFNYSHNLKYKEKPNYNFLIKSFLFELKKNNSYDIIWSWN